jgi:hypothetical protein
MVCEARIDFIGGGQWWVFQFFKSVEDEVGKPSSILRVSAPKGLILAL